MYTENNLNLNYIKIWLILIFILLSLMIFIGGMTRLTDSGLSITEWELFRGFFPPLTVQSWNNYFDLYKEIPEFKNQNYNMSLDEFKIIFWWEWSHRFLGRLIGLFYLFPFLYFFKKMGIIVFRKYFYIFIFICLQGFIGWYMVTSGLVDRTDVSQYRLALHLFLAFVILSCIYWEILNSNKNIHSNSNYFISLPMFFLILLFIQIILGAFVSGMDAGLIYNTWPLMGSSFFPDDSLIIDLFTINIFNDPSLMQFMHRISAYVIFLLYLYILFRYLNTKNKKIILTILVIGIFLLFQIILGIFTVLSGAKILYASLHQINSILLICSSIYFLYLRKNI